MTVIPRQGYHKAGIARQGAQDVLAPPDALITGDYPPLSGIDWPMAAGITLAPLSVVGFNANGKLVMATYGGPGTYATNQLGFGVVPGDGQTVTIGGMTYRFSDAVNAPGRVARGASGAQARDNLVAAINNSPIEGRIAFWQNDHEAHPGVFASPLGGSTLRVQARYPGAEGNTIAVAETVNGDWQTAGSLIGGAGGIQPVGILPYEGVAGPGENPDIPVHPTGVFNPDMLVWDSSFNTDEKRRSAFFGALAPTNIMIRKIRANTV